MESLLDRLGSFLEELKRRRVYTVAAGYAAVAFVVWQAAAIAFPALQLPSWTVTLVVALAILGFPIALVLAWAFEVTPEGVHRAPMLERPAEPGRQAPEPETGRRPRLLLTGALLLTAGALVFGGYSLLLGDGSSPRPDTPEIRSLAVLPLENLAPDPEAEQYFADGMTEALTAGLGQISALSVRGRTSAMRFRESDRPIPEIAAELGVDALIEGSVLRAGDEVRVTVQLVHGPTDRHLWSKNYERDLRDVLALQAEVARNVAEEIQVTVAPEVRDRLATEHTAHPQAYEAYLKGRFHFERGEMAGQAAVRRSMRHYEEAISLDSTFALAHAALAEACVQPLIVNTVRPLEECKETALKALELDPDLAEAYAALGQVKAREWDWDGSEAAFRRAIDLNPNSVMARLWYSNFLSTMLRRQQAVQEILRAEELDPLNLFVKFYAGVQLMRQGRHDEAMARWDEILSMDPNYGLVHYIQGLSHADRGDPAKALASASRAADHLGEDAVRVRIMRAFAHAVGGNDIRALEILHGVEQEVGDRARVFIGAIATVHFHLGQEEEAFGWLENGYALRNTYLPSITSEPFLDELRGHPRFRALRQKMGLP